MSKELIRNGGLERGDFEFWELETGAMVISIAEVHTGSYSLYFGTSGGVAKINIKDYIMVSPGAIYKASIWLYNVDLTVSAVVYILFYDSNKTKLDEYGKIGETVGTGAWEHIVGHAEVPEGAVYARVSMWATGAGEQYGYIDELSLQEIDLSKISVTKKELITVINETTKHTVTGDEFFSGIWKEAEYFFDLTSFTETVGANPVTIDVKIESYDPETDTWRDAMVFQQKSCPASGNVTTQEYKRLVGGLGWKQRVSYTTAGAGTIGDCDFKVGVVYKR